MEWDHSHAPRNPKVEVEEIHQNQTTRRPFQVLEERVTLLIMNNSNVIFMCMHMYTLVQNTRIDTPVGTHWHLHSIVSV